MNGLHEFHHGFETFKAICRYIRDAILYVAAIAFILVALDAFAPPGMEMAW